MLISALGSIGDRLDSKFITAYFFPAFVAVLGTIAILVRQAGDARFIAWVAQFDSLQQGVIVFALLLGTFMLAHMLRAMARPIAQVFAGRAYPEVVRRLLLPVQERDHARARGDQRAMDRGERLFPRERGDLEPTAFGNILAASADYPRLVYGMETYHWWPRLLPLMPAEFQDALRALETPMRAMLNLSLVALYLGCLAGALGMTHGDLLAAGVGLALGLFLAGVFYQAAIAQAVELARTIWVGFDLYRYEILKQMNIELPASIEAERALWPRLTAERLGALGKAATAIPANEDGHAGETSAEASTTASAG
jgi:hypothetical protein